jgi:hypothetical protein
MRDSVPFARDAGSRCTASNDSAALDAAGPSVTAVAVRADRWRKSRREEVMTVCEGSVLTYGIGSAD